MVLLKNRFIFSVVDVLTTTPVILLKNCFIFSVVEVLTNLTNTHTHGYASGVAQRIMMFGTHGYMSTYLLTLFEYIYVFEV